MNEFDWIEDSEKLYNINDHFNKISHKTIKTIFVYINDSNYIDKIKKQNIQINNDCISNKTILKLIYENRIKNNKAVYNFDSLSLFHIPIEHDKINNFNNMEMESYNYLHNMNINTDINIPPSLFIFHNISTLFIFYKQKLLENTVTSILKSCITPKCNNKKTKKRVTIKESFRKTKKSNII